MKRYLAFKGDTHYPIGGWDDFVGAFDTIEETRAAIKVDPVWGWSQVVDTETLKEIPDET